MLLGQPDVEMWMNEVDNFSKCFVNSNIILGGDCLHKELVKCLCSFQKHLLAGVFCKNLLSRLVCEMFSR